MAYSIYLGLDLGQASDPSALCVLEEPVYCPPLGGWVSGQQVYANVELRELYKQGAWRAWDRQRPGRPPLWLRSLTRFPLRTSYPTIVASVIQRLGTEPRDDAVLVVDGTGVGRAVVDMFRFADPPLPCALYPVVITGGVKVERNHVPKRDLIGAVQVLLHTSRLKVSRKTAETETWAKEMQNYQMKLTASGHDTYNARGDSQHDDLVLAVALACWYRGALNRGNDG